VDAKTTTKKHCNLHVTAADGVQALELVLHAKGIGIRVKLGLNALAEVLHVAIDLGEAKGAGNLDEIRLAFRGERT